LSEGSRGDEGRICETRDVHSVSQRLVELGFVQGEWVRVERRSFFGDLIVSLSGTRVAVRAEEAKLIQVEKCSESHS
jgi:Fe2+ transport system protein FeoA